MANSLKKGILFALVTATISGFSIFYNKLVMVKGVDPLIFNILRNGGVAIILSTILLCLPLRKTLIKLPQHLWKKLFLIGAIGGSIPFILFFEGLRLVPAINASLIHKTLFIWVAVMAIPFLGERLNFWQVIGYLIVAWSNLFIGGFAGFKGSQGEVMILAATLFWSLENVIAKITLKELESLIVAWGRMFIGSIILIMIAIIQNKLFLFSKLTAEQIIPIIGSILFLTGYVLSWYKALKLAPATLVTSVLILSTPITNILTAAFISRTLPQPQLVSILITLFGLCLILPLLPSIKKKATI